MLTHAGSLARMTVLDADGRKVELGTLWRDRPAVLVFVRHFGCVHSRAHVIQLHRDIERLHGTGAEVYVIGNGAPHYFEGFRELTGWRGPIYTDPSLAIYRAAGLRRGITKNFHPRTYGPTLRAWGSGGRQGCTQGDQWQQGGLLVILPGGEVRWHHVSRWPGDNASTAQILDALRGVRDAPSQERIASGVA
jgi:hypothetical protein